MMAKLSDVILGGLIGGLMALAGFGLLIAPVKTILGVAFVGAAATLVDRLATAPPQEDESNDVPHGTDS
jgi:hypothetical protein